MKTFKDLVFHPHRWAVEMDDRYNNAKHADLAFPNRYGVSVLFGKCFYSNGVDTYELAVLLNGDINYDNGVTDDVMGHLSEDEVSEVMRKVQNL